MPKNHLSAHDRYIRSILSHASVAREFFEKHLPPDVIKIIDFSTLEPQKDSFINDKLRLKVADLLFSVNFNGDPGYIYLLLEHASKPDRLLPYRMLQYTMSIMDQHLKNRKTKNCLLLCL
jgi:predicted transposase/invertase (TIGR01784 family)